MDIVWDIHSYACMVQIVSSHGLYYLCGVLVHVDGVGHILQGKCMFVPPAVLVAVPSPFLPHSHSHSPCSLYLHALCFLGIPARWNDYPCMVRGEYRGMEVEMKQEYAPLGVHVLREH